MTDPEGTAVAEEVTEIVTPLSPALSDGNWHDAAAALGGVGELSVEEKQAVSTQLQNLITEGQKATDPFVRDQQMHRFSSVVGEALRQFPLEAPESEFVYELLFSQLEKFGVDAELMLTRWARSCGEADIPKIVADNLRIVIQIESQAPGGTATLQNEFGICDVARYPLEMLFNQINLADLVKNKETLPISDFGMISYPDGDDESIAELPGGFYNDKELLMDAYRQSHLAQSECLVIEVSSALELVHYANAWRKRFQTPASYGIIAGHGTPDSIILSANSEVTGKDMRRISTAVKPALHQLLKPGAPLGFFACSVAKDVGDPANPPIAQLAAEVTGTHTVGPDNVAVPEKIRLQRDETGQFNMDITYSTAVGNVNTSHFGFA